MGRGGGWGAVLLQPGVGGRAHPAQRAAEHRLSPPQRTKSRKPSLLVEDDANRVLTALEELLKRIGDGAFSVEFRIYESKRTK